MRAAAAVLALWVGACAIQAHAQAGASLSDAITICNRHLISDTGSGAGYHGDAKFEAPFQTICANLFDSLARQRDEQLRDASQLDLAHLKRDLGMTP